MISASRGAAAPSRHRRASSPGEEVVGGFFFDIEAVRTESRPRCSAQVSERPDSFCNYLEGSIMQWGDDTKLIYRHYATLYFVFAVDKLESDLGILDLIQVFVEALDKCFENVCELDLIFHSDKVHYILDEIVMAGMVLETNIVTILNGVNDQTKLHQKSTSKLNEALGKATSTKMGSPGVR
jgi:AP-3 complex subunit sigma